MPQEITGDAGGAPTSGRRRGTAHKALLTAVVLGVTGIVGGVGTWSAFSATTGNAGNQFASGSVTLTDDEGDGNTTGNAMFNISGMKPGDAVEKCIRVTYSGSLPATVKLYGPTSGTGLGDHLEVTVTRGMQASTSITCSGFEPDPYDYPAGTTGDNGVIINSTLTRYKDGYDTGFIDPNSTDGNAEVWGGGSETHTYKIRVALPSTTSNTAQGLDAQQTFTWEARNN